jgi:hypothetical protein
MAARKQGRTTKATRAKATAAGSRPKRDDRLMILGALVRDDTWMRRISSDLVLHPGTPTDSYLRVPAKEAERILHSTVRVVADLPIAASTDVVWVSGDSELVVHTDGVRLGCDPGVVTISIPVSCDQVADGAVVDVPLAVGTEDAPSGLVMSTFTRPHGPELIVNLWADAITAFAWEALLHLTQQLSGEVGRDAENRPLVPATVGAARGELLIQPMARHELFGGGR